MTTDPRIASLAGAAEAAAIDWSPYRSVTVGIMPPHHGVIQTTVKGPIAATSQDLSVRSYFTLEELDELLRNLMAARADLVKLQGGK